MYTLANQYTEMAWHFWEGIPNIQYDHLLLLEILVGTLNFFALNFMQYISSCLVYTNAFVVTVIQLSRPSLH
jgi:hypothetical protein